MAEAIVTKRCPSCNEEKLLSAFSPTKDPRYRLGVRSNCKVCLAAKAKARREADPEKAAAIKRKSYEKNIDKNRQDRRDYYERNREKEQAASRERMRITRLTNPERTRDASKRHQKFGHAKRLLSRKRYRDSHPEKVAAQGKASRAKKPDLYRTHYHNRRARERGAEGSHTLADIERIRKQQRDRCAHPWCRVKLYKRGHRDHIISLKIGGSNWPANIQLLCGRCNCKKRATHPTVWAQMHGYLL